VSILHTLLGARHHVLVLALAASATQALSAGVQDARGADVVERFKQVFAGAVGFSPKIDNPPHFKAYTKDSAARDHVAGFVFWTTDLEPLERGYSGPIRILVGMTTAGLLTGISVVSHREPYGDFSIDRPAYAAQFRGKSIRDAFRLGADIDAVSRATVTMSSATRSVRNSARRIARELIGPGLAANRYAPPHLSILDRGIQWRNGGS
jgi:transcriptional regulator of nitric oxide reductase